LEVLHRRVHSLVRDPVQGWCSSSSRRHRYRRGRALELEETAPFSMNSTFAATIRRRKVFDLERD
jgi:hypothetical protein